MSIFAVVVHAPDVAAGLLRYQQAFPSAKRKSISESFFEYLDVGGVNIEIVSADEKVASGAAGSVVYWQAEDFDLALSHVQSIGARCIAAHHILTTASACVRCAIRGVIASDFAAKVEPSSPPVIPRIPQNRAHCS